MKQRTLWIAAVMALAIPGASYPQGDTPRAIKSRSDLVVVPVTVKDSQGRLVGDLQRDEFRVFQDGVEQQIAIFSSDPFPLSAVVLIDNDLSQKPAEQVQKSLESIAAGFGSSDEVALAVYSEYPQLVSDFSFSNDQVFTQLKRLELGSHFPGIGSGPMTAGPPTNDQSRQFPLSSTHSEAVTKCLDDAVYAAADMLKSRGRDRRKIIFLISDGNNARNNQHSFEQTLELLLTADVSVYSISVGHAFLQKESSRLTKYANDTGGDTFYASKQGELERLYSAVTEEARNQYTLAFVPLYTAEHRDYHPIEVRVRRAGLNLLAREGYYTPAPK